MEETHIQLAGCVMLDDYGRILLIHRSFNDSGLWYLPGGRIEDEESPENAAIRETEWQLGVKIELVKKLGDATFEHEADEYIFYWFQARAVNGEPQVENSGSFDDLDYFEIEDMPSLALSAASEILETRIVSGEVVLD